MRDFGLGTRTFFAAFGFAFRHGLWWLFLFPLLFWFLLTALMLRVDHWVVAHVGGWITEHLHISVEPSTHGGFASLWENVKAFFDRSKDLLIHLALRLVLWYLFTLIGKYVVLAALSPVMAYASERTERILTGRDFPFQWGPFVKEVVRGVLMALRNGSMELALNLIIWVATLFMPLLAPVSALLLFGISCWYYGFSMFDYIHERHRSGIRASLAQARARTWLVLGNGLWSNVLIKVPVFGVIFVPIMGSIGAVLALHVNHTPQSTEHRGPEGLH